MRRGESPHRSTALMNKRKPIVYFQKKRNKKKRKRKKIGKGGYIQNVNTSPKIHDHNVSKVSDLSNFKYILHIK